MFEAKYGNSAQTVSANEIQFTSGLASGKNCILIHNEGLEVLISKDNALDILYVKYNGKNVSFLSRNGINTKTYGFADRFEGGFLYTCGLDNIGGCVEGAVKHGSLHLTKAENVNVFYQGDDVIVTGLVRQTTLFDFNTVIERRFTISKNSIAIKDVVTNNDYADKEHCILYHVNFGYPFLSENLKLEIPSEKIIPVDDFAKEGINDCLKMSKPIDNLPERCYYHYLKDGKVSLTNDDLKIKIDVNYDLNALPILVEWKMMSSGIYALGIEPSSTRFDEFKPTVLKQGESKEYNVSINFFEG